MTTALTVVIIMSLTFSDELKERYAKKIYHRYIDQVFNLNKHHAQVVLRDLGSKGQVHCFAATNRLLPVAVDNYSRHSLVSSPESDPKRGIGVNLSYRVFDATGERMISEGRRHLFEPAVASRSQAGPATRLVNLPVKCPDAPGTYQLRLEIVQEGLNWQSHLPGNNWIARQLVVWNSAQLSEATIPSGLFEGFLPDLTTLNLGSSDHETMVKAYRLARNVLALGGTELILDKKKYLVADAGTSYPMVWIRDMVAIAQAHQLLQWRGASIDSHWSELFFSRQSEFGSTPDWISFVDQPGVFQRAGKNTVQSDQELWLVFSIMQDIENGNLAKRWLSESTNGMSHATRIANAVRFVLDRRFDMERGCVWSGHVADWGDVGPRGLDSSTSTKIAYGAPKVCGIYMQSLFALVMPKLLDHAVAGKPLLDARLTARVQAGLTAVRRFAQNMLWNRSGYFEIHQHLEPHKHRFPEQEIFAMPGNLLAIRSGLANSGQAKRILERLRRYQLAGKPVGVVLHPPYPANTFENPIMDERYEYQNGGDWDWHGADAALALVKLDPQAGIQALVQIARKVVLNQSFSEWNTLGGEAEGSGNFQAGAARFVTTLHALSGERSQTNL